MGISKRSN
jgi:serine/threonine protein kinase